MKKRARLETVDFPAMQRYFAPRMTVISPTDTMVSTFGMKQTEAAHKTPGEQSRLLQIIFLPVGATEESGSFGRQ